MPEALTFIEILKEVNWDIGVEINPVDEESCLIHFKEKYWKFWINEGRWIETDDSGEPIGVIHHGSIAAFREKHIVENTYLPRNHSKVWTIDERTQLQALIARDLTIPEMAKAMGRSQRSIVAKSGAILGVNFDHMLANEDLLKQTIKSLILQL